MVNANEAVYINWPIRFIAIDGRNTGRLVWKMVEDGCKLELTSSSR
jgi:hypothetical protein